MSLWIPKESFSHIVSLWASPFITLLFTNFPSTLTFSLGMTWHSLSTLLSFLQTTHILPTYLHQVRPTRSRLYDDDDDDDYVIFTSSFLLVVAVVNTQNSSHRVTYPIIYIIPTHTTGTYTHTHTLLKETTHNLYIPQHIRCCLSSFPYSIVLPNHHNVIHNESYYISFFTPLLLQPPQVNL